MSSERFKFACAPTEDSDQAARLRSLIRVFNERFIGSQGSTVSCRRKTKTLIRLCECADCFYAHANLFLMLDPGSRKKLSNISKV